MCHGRDAVCHSHGCDPEWGRKLRTLETADASTDSLALSISAPLDNIAVPALIKELEGVPAGAPGEFSNFWRSSSMLNTVFTNDIRQTLDQFRRSVDHLFDNFYGYPTERQTSGPEHQDWSFSPVLESAWNNDALWLRAIVPGVRQGDVNVSLQGNQLVLTGERKAPEGFGVNGFTHLTYGKFSTSVALPNGLDVEKVRCELHDGVLDIRIPMAESMKPRQIPIQTGAEQKAISA
jgi:HSP20 family protein